MKKLLPVLALFVLLLVGSVHAAYQDDYVDRYITNYLDPTLLMQDTNSSPGHQYYGSFDSSVWNNSVTNTVASRFNEWISAGAKLWAYNFTPTMHERTYQNATILNRTILAGDYYVHSIGSRGGWITADTKATINPFLHNQYDATAFGLDAITQAYMLINGSLGNLTYVGDYGDDDDLRNAASQEFFVWSDNLTGRWNDSTTIGNTTYRCVNDSNFVYTHLNLPYRLRELDTDWDGFADVNYTVTIWYNNTADRNVNVSVKYTGGSAPTAFRNVGYINTSTNGSYQSVTFVVNLTQPALISTATQNNDTIIFFHQSTGVCYDKIQFDIDRREVWKRMISRGAHMLTNTQHWMGNGNLSNDEENTIYWYANNEIAGVSGRCKRAINQMPYAATGLVRAYNITGNETFLNESFRQMACFFSVNSEYLDREPNLGDLYDTGFNNNSVNTAGIDAGYNIVAASGAAHFYEATGNETARLYVDGAINNSQRFWLPNYTMGDIRIITSPATRTSVTKAQYGGPSEEGYFIHPLLVATAWGNPYAIRTMNIIQNNASNANYTLTDTFKRTIAGLIFQNYRIWNTSNTSVLLDNENTTKRYGAYYNRTGVDIYKTLNYVASIGTNNVTTSGGNLQMVFNSQTRRFLFSGYPYVQVNTSLGNQENDTYLSGTHMMLRGTNNSGCSDGFDYQTVRTFTDTYPFNSFANGSMRYLNQTPCGVTFSNNITLYDRYLYVQQLPSSNVELRIWSVITTDTGTEFIPARTPRVINNVTFLPVSFNLNYTTENRTGSYGTVRKANASGSNFTYYLGISPDLTAVNYFQDLNGRRLALPIDASSGSLSAALSSNLTVAVNNVTVVVNTTCVEPIYPYIAFANATQQLVNWTYNASSCMMTANVSVDAGNSSLVLQSINVTGSGNTRSINSSYQGNQAVSLNISTGITPSNPKMVYQNGTSESLSYLFPGGFLIVNVSALPNGSSLLTIDAAGPSLGNASVSPASITVGDVVLLSVDALDEGNLTVVTSVSANVTIGGSTTVVPLTLANGMTYTGSFGGTGTAGSYSVVFWATDAYNNTGTASGGTFAAAAASSPGGGGGGGGGGSGSGAVGAADTAPNMTRFDLTNEPKDASSRRTFLFIIIGAVTVFLIAIGVFSFK